MNICSKLVLLIVFFALLVGCKADSPSSSSSSDNSSSDSNSTETNVTSYVGKWVKTDNLIGLDWRSDSFIYACTNVNNITYAAHGSYSTTNSRLTWWDGSYNTVTSSGNNILLDSNTYTPAVLYANCNPFWTNSTSENTSYTNLAKSMGNWTFTYTISNTYTDYINMLAITSAQNISVDNNYITAGVNGYNKAVIGNYVTSSQVYDILDASDSTYNQYYAFYINSSYSGITTGCYYIYNKSSSPTSCVSITSGTKSYGTPRSYRLISEHDEDKIELQKKKEMTALMNQSSNKLTEQDISAYQRYQNLLRTYESIDKEPLKRFLKSFRSN